MLFYFDILLFDKASTDTTVDPLAVTMLVLSTSKSVYIMENIRYHHGTLVGDNCFYFFPVLAFFFFNEQKIVGLGVKIRVDRVTGNQPFFFFCLM
jgi:hypothetical protein